MCCSVCERERERVSVCARESEGVRDRHRTSLKEAPDTLTLCCDPYTRTGCTGTGVRSVRVEDDPIHTIHC